MFGSSPADTVAITNPGGGLFSFTWYGTGNCGFIVKDALLSEPLKEYDEPLLVDAIILNLSAVGQSTEVKLHLTCLFTIKVPVAGVVPLSVAGVVPLPVVYNRFRFGIPPTQDKADFAFIQHMCSSLNGNGQAAITC